MARRIPVDDRTGHRTVPETSRRADRLADRISGNRYGNRPTMKDVAARAGVGLKTVSRVVNAEPGVTPETERRVQEAIDALGFRRNDSARVLRKGRTASIGLVLEDLADPF
jgi:LacI family transcriptional regulator, galactose operon repressor